MLNNFANGGPTMRSEALVQLALNTLSCSQKELAMRLGVSPTQISKWKKGEHMSFEMEVKRQRNFFSVKIFRRVHRDGNLSLSG